MKISAERTKKEKKRKGTSKNLSYFSSRNWWSTIGSGTEAPSYTLYNLSEERRRSGKANYRYWWNKWGEEGNAQSVSRWRMEFLKQSKHAKHFSDEIPGNTSAKPPSDPFNFVQSTFENRPCFALLLHECKTSSLYFYD